LTDIYNISPLVRVKNGNKKHVWTCSQSKVSLFVIPYFSYICPKCMKSQHTQVEIMMCIYFNYWDKGKLPKYLRHANEHFICLPNLVSPPYSSGIITHLNFKKIFLQVTEFCWQSISFSNWTCILVSIISRSVSYQSYFCFLEDNTYF
jgi:hypothetical protein